MPENSLEPGSGYRCELRIGLLCGGECERKIGFSVEGELPTALRELADMLEAEDVELEEKL